SPTFMPISDKPHLRHVRCLKYSLLLDIPFQAKQIHHIHPSFVSATQKSLQRQTTTKKKQYTQQINPQKKSDFTKKTHYSQKITQKSNINTIKIQFFSIFLLYLSK